MTDSAPVIYSILSGDASLVALLSSIGAAPAIFMEDPVPVTATRPYIYSPGDLGMTPLAPWIAGRHNPVFERDITAIVDRAAGTAAVVAIADRIHALFYQNGHRSTRPTWSAGGFTLLETDVAGGPLVTPTDDTLIGRTITATIKLQPTS